jgi:hypothetical protein
MLFGKPYPKDYRRPKDAEKIFEACLRGGYESGKRTDALL